MSLVDSVGLTTHPDKSVVIPTQCIGFVGFILESRDMAVRLAPRKASDIKMHARGLLHARETSIRYFA